MPQTTTTRPTQKTDQGEGVEELPTERPEGVDEALEATDDLLDEIDSLLSDTAIERMQATLDDTVPYTLADAMREGAQMGDQAFGALKWNETTCAIGAAIEAVTARGLV